MTASSRLAHLTKRLLVPDTFPTTLSRWSPHHRKGGGGMTKQSIVGQWDVGMAVGYSTQNFQAAASCCKTSSNRSNKQVLRHASLYMFRMLFHVSIGPQQNYKHDAYQDSVSCYQSARIACCIPSIRSNALSCENFQSSEPSDIHLGSGFALG